MNVTASLAFAVAERVERTGGPRAGLVAWKKLAANASDATLRGRALLSALRCAVALRDGPAVDELTLLWESVDRGVWEVPIAALCTEMARGGLLPRAIALAHADARRHRTARSLYCHARCLDIARDPRAADAFRDAIARAEKEGAREIELASRVRRAVILARSWDTMAEALSEAAKIDPNSVDARSRLEIAAVQLRSPSRFTRAAAIATLDGLVVGDDASLAERAIVLAARWADDAGDALTPLEADRLTALFGRERAVKLAPRAKAVVRALAKVASASDEATLTAALEETGSAARELVPLHARARDILGGRYEALPVTESSPADPPRDPAVRHVLRWSQMLDVVVAMRDRSTARAAHALRALADVEATGEPLPAAILGIVQAALSSDDPELREVAVRLLDIRLRRASAGKPPRGYVLLADTLASLGATELSVRARRVAVVAKEPGAAESLGMWLAREGWELARTSQRSQAIAKLREAKALLTGART